MAENKVDLVTATIKDRVVTVHPIGNELQIAAFFRLGRMAEALERQATAAETAGNKNLFKELTDKAIKTSAQILDAIEDMLVDENDRDWLVAEMLGGRLEFEDLHDLMKAAGAGASVKPAKKAVRVAR